MSQDQNHTTILPENVTASHASSPSAVFLEQQHLLLSAIVNASEDAILSKTLDGIITTWNPAAERMFGFSADEIVGKPKTLLFPPDRLQEEAAILERLQQGLATPSFETIRLRKDGTPIHVSVTVSPIADQNGHVVGASTVARDITERKQNEQNEEQVRLLSTVAAASVNGIVITDPQQRFLYVNPAFERLTGYTLEELRGKRPGDVLQGPDTDRETLQLIRAAVCAQHPVTAELLNYHKNGTPYWIEIHVTPVRNALGEVTHFIAIETDITQRMRAEAALRERHDELTSLIEAIPDVIYRVNRDGICLENLGNDKSYSLTKTHDMRGRSLRDFVPAHVADIVRGGIDAALSTQTLQTLQYQVEIEGTVRHRDTRIVALSEDAALLVIRDVTASKATERELRQSEARFHAFMKECSYYAWITDAEGTIEYLNEPYCRMIGRSLEDCVGRHVLDLYPAEVAHDMLTNIRQVVRTGETLQAIESAPLPDGKLHHFLVHKFMLGEVNGRVLVGGSAIDITARRQMEKEMLEVTTLQRAILDSADYSIISTDVQGTILTFNHAAERMLGYSAEEVVGKVTPAIIHDAQEVAARAEYLSQELGQHIQPGFEVFIAKTVHALSNEASHNTAREASHAAAEETEDHNVSPHPGQTSDESEWTYIRKDGSRFPVRLSVTALRDGTGTVTGYLGIAQDITARVKAEQAILDNIKRQDIIIAAQQAILNAGHDLHALMQCAVEHCQQLEVADGAIVELIEGNDTVFTAVSGIATPLLGMHLQQHNTLSGQSIRENQMLCWDDTEQVDPILREAFRAAGIRSLIVVPLQRDGHVIGVLKVLSARPAVFTENDQIVLRLIAGFLSSALLTAATDRNLRRNEERLRAAQQVARMGSWEYDLGTGKVSWSNELFRLLDLDPAQGEPDYSANLALYHPDDAARLDACVQLAVRTGTGYALDLRRAPLEAQPTRWYHAVGKAVQNANGHVVQLTGTFTDITERKAIEEAVLQSQEKLNLAQKLAHVGSWERDFRDDTMTWSDEMFRLCGLEPGAVNPSFEALFAYIHPLDRPWVRKRMEEAIQARKGTEYELRLVGADGVLRHVFIQTEALHDAAGRFFGSHGTVADVTERVKALQEQTKFVSLIENSSDFIAIAGLDGALLSLNPAGRKLVGLRRVEEVTSTHLLNFMPPEVWSWVRQDVLPVVLRDDRWEGECQLVNVATGNVYDMQASFFLIRHPLTGEPMCLATVQRDITSQKWLNSQLQQNIALIQEQNVQLELQHQKVAFANAHLQTANALLESLATTDGLTGAKNHRAFQEKLSEEFKRADRGQKTLSLILLDVDKFKQYNDEFGHPNGDQVLKLLVQVLQQTARESDFVARYGGEEFVILLPETAAAGAIEAAERFRTAIEAVEWPLRPVTASFGVATLCATSETGHHLVDWADRALYASKATGRNRVTHADTLAMSESLSL